MNLKGKLAKEYAQKTVKEDCPSTGDWVNIAHDWLQGFETAQKLALEMMFKHLQNKELDWQTCTDLIWCDLRKLGKEEIK